MSVRVDLDKLKELSKKVMDLESEARRKRTEYGAMVLQVQELKNTIEGLKYHMGFEVEITNHRGNGDSTVVGKKTSPIRTDEDIETVLEQWPGDEKTPESPEVMESMLAQLPPSKSHWTPMKRNDIGDDETTITKKVGKWLKKKRR